MRSAKFSRYKPKRWHPEFDLIIIASFSGKSNEEIGKTFGYTKEHISNILCSEEAERVRQRLRGKIDEEIDDNISQRFKKVSEIALKRIEDFMNNDELAIKSPFLFVDRAYRAAQIAGISQEKSTISANKIEVNTNIQNNVGNEVIDRIALALEKSNEVKLLHAGLDPTKQIKLDNVRVDSGDRPEEDR